MGSAGDLFPLGVLPQVNRRGPRVCRRAARSRRGVPSPGNDWIRRAADPSTQRVNVGAHRVNGRSAPLPTA